MSLLFRSVLVFCAMAALFSCSGNKGEIEEKDQLGYTDSDHRKIGDQLLYAILDDPAGFPVLSEAVHPMAYSYLRDSVFRIVLNTPQVTRRSDFDWEIYILEDDAASMAFCLPGGKFFIHSGLLKFLEGNHQLMALIAHEIAYAENGAALKRLEDHFGGQTLGRILLDRPVEELGDMVDYAKIMDYSLRQVTEADAFAIQLICPFRYDPEGLLQIFDKSQETGTHVDWLLRRRGERLDDRRLLIREVLSELGNCNPGTKRLEEAYERFRSQYLPR